MTYRLAILVPLAGLLGAQETPTGLLEAKCLHCHGETRQMGRLDLRTRESALRGGEHGAALAPGSAEASKLWAMVSGAGTPRMPLGGRLDDAELALLRRWIVDGAPYPAQPLVARNRLSETPEPPLRDADRRWWAFQPLRPDPAGASVDTFVNAGLAARGIRPAPRASKETLIRRVSLDLRGLPPSPEETAAFLADREPGAWSRLVDRMLASPDYGERWGRHWLDVARYADSNGYEHDFDRPHAWRYRDYVIDAVNQDLPFDRFLTEQLAGDEMERPTYRSLTATGFLRNYAKVGFREKDNPEFRFEYLDDMIATLGRGVLGLTVQCARCHDHKFDPISQKDYYRMQASLFGYVEVDHPLVPPAEAKAWRAENGRIDAAVAALRGRLREIEAPYAARLLPAKYAKYPPAVQEAIATPEERRSAGQRLLANQVVLQTRVSAAEIDRIASAADTARRREIQHEIAALEHRRPPAPPLAMGITDGDYRLAPDGPGDEPAPGKGAGGERPAGSFLFEGPGRYAAPPSFLLLRGDRHTRGEPMEPGYPRIVAGSSPAVLPPADGRTSGRRLALAKWLTAPENPLTARVLANRIWHHHFGRGLVATLDNFGRMGERPSHPELLDWLARRLIDGGWSWKGLHRIILNSEAYQRESVYDDAVAAAADPAGRLLWRYPMTRLDAEAVRDQMLAVSGALNRTRGGPAVFPHLPEEVRASTTKGVWRQPAADGPETWRRSVYIYRKRGLPFPFLEAFDLPDQNIACGARTVSTAPTQALLLLNDPFVIEQARLFAGRVAEAGGADPVGYAFRLALGRAPREEERAAVAGLDGEAVAHVLFNLNEFVYRR